MPTLLITGASRGLGLEFVHQYAAEGWDIIAACRTPAKADKLKALAEAISKIRVETLDVNNAASIKAMAEKLNGVVLDVLINNAGIFSGDNKPRSANQSDPSQDFGSIDAEAWQRVLFTNTISPIMVLQAFLPHLSAAKNAKVVNVTSKMGSIDDMGGGFIAYRTSKAALNAAMATIVNDLSQHHIAIVNLHPGWVKTDMGGPNANLTADVSIKGMRKVIAELSKNDTGQFMSYDGKVIPW